MHEQACTQIDCVYIHSIEQPFSAHKISFAAVVRPAALHQNIANIIRACCFGGALISKWCAAVQATASAGSDMLMKATPGRQSAEKRATAAGWGSSDLVR